MYKHNYIKLVQFQILILFPLQCVSLPSTSLNETVSDTEHLKLQRVKDLCAKNNTICESSPKYYLCTIRKENGKMVTKDFESYCSFFLINMCEYPGNEWAIKDSGSCQNVNLRRFKEQIENETQSNEAENVTDDALREGETAANNTTEDVPDISDELGSATASTAVTALRELHLKEIKYGIDYAPDDHPCPLFCTTLYSPVCVNINRGLGQYYKLLFFVNHCEADRHYCMYFNTEYTPPPDYEYEMVNRPSNAAWSYCAASKYMNFATFAESASSLAHYGWLRGSQRPEHIMEPHERVPGFG